MSRRFAASLIALIGLAGAAILRTPAPSQASDPASQPLAVGSEWCAPGHWASPSVLNQDDRVPQQCASCAVPVNRADRACAVSAILWSAPCASAPTCGDRIGAFRLDHARRLALQQSLRFLVDPDGKDRLSNCHFLVWALDPIIGLEDGALRDSPDLWRQAHHMAAHWIEPAIPDAELALLVQPPILRGQHQLHLHLGRWQPADQQAIASLRREPGQVQRLRLRSGLAWARFVPAAQPDDPFSGASPFAVAEAITPGGARAVLRHSIAVAIPPRASAAADGPSGMFVLSLPGMGRDQLLLRQPRRCRILSPAASSPAEGASGG